MICSRSRRFFVVKLIRILCNASIKLFSIVLAKIFFSTYLSFDNLLHIFVITLKPLLGLIGFTSKFYIYGLQLSLKSSACL